MSAPHIPVLKDEIVRFFSPCSLQVFVDATVGAGGHSEEILHFHPEIEKLVAIDQDPTALEIAQSRLKAWEERLIFIAGNFEDLPSYLDEHHIDQVDGILLDLGVSSMQFDRPEKGFSFQQDGPLDMRMDPNSKLTAEEIVNSWSEEELGRLFREYGEEKQWRRAARVIVSARKDKHIRTTRELVDILLPALFFRKKGVHPLTLIFQALRISVNRELEVLKEVLPRAIKSLSPGGRLAVISFHSLEDRIVKRVFRDAASDKVHTSGLAGMFLDKTPEVKLLTPKPICPTTEEISQNPRSRSAKLRVVEKI